MNYEIRLKNEAVEELDKLSNRERLLVFKQFKKIYLVPTFYVGNPYENIINNKIKFPYAFPRKSWEREIENEVVIEIIAIGKRDEMEVYKKAAERIN